LIGIRGFGILYPASVNLRPSPAIGITNLSVMLLSFIFKIGTNSLLVPTLLYTYLSTYINIYTMIILKSHVEKSGLTNFYKNHWINVLEIYNQMGLRGIEQEYVIIKATSDVEIPDSFAKLLSADCAIFNWVDGDIDPYNFMADWATFSKIVLFWKWTDSYNNKDIPFGTDDTNNAELTSKWLDMVGVKYTTLDKLCNIQK